jgi:UDP-N-acetylglucosamine--dolichyl-phosphate N-acetylglucosaminephosphotransferase
MSCRPEAMGVIVGLCFLIIAFMFIPFSFIPWNNSATTGGDLTKFPYEKLATFLSGILSLTCMLFLGFADDVLELRWKFKLILPTIASIPLLMVYYVTYGVTSVVVPQPLRFLFGNLIDLGFLYYVYMGMLAVFCTNAINIVAGINGVESGQALAISICIAINDCLYLIQPLRAILDRASLVHTQIEQHRFSLCLVIPFILLTFALYLRNKYPAQVFVGDTFCYFSGMIFAVLGILGRYSKTLLLFFIPQIINFIYSLPQLFRLIPCPRHRMPGYDEDSDVVTPSYSSIQKEEHVSNVKYWLGLFCLSIFYNLGLIDFWKREDDKPRGGGRKKRSSSTSVERPPRIMTPSYIAENFTHVNNLTLLNFVLIKFGPMREESLTNVIMIIQFIFGGVLAFAIRYGLVHLAYP